MKAHVLAALSSKVAIGVTAGVLAFGSAGAVVATQAINHSSDGDPTTTTTSTTLDDNGATNDDAVTNDSAAQDESPDDHGTDFSTQVRDLAQDDEREGGIGEQVSQLAHDRNDERQAADQNANRGPGSVNSGHDDADDDEADDSADHDANDDDVAGTADRHGGDDSADD